MIVAVTLAAALASCVAPSGDESADDELAQYRAHVRQVLAELVSDASQFPRKGANERGSLSKVKAAISDLLDAADSKPKMAALAEQFVDALCGSDQFRFFEYYVIWRGSKLLRQNASPRLLFALQKKINNRDKVAGAPDEVLLEMCAMSIEIIEDACDYEASDAIVRDADVNWTEWHSMSRWLDGNRGKLRLDRGRGKWAGDKADARSGASPAHELEPGAEDND